MHGEHSPLFGEYLKLTSDAGWNEVLDAQSKLQIGPQDALIVVDMQNDFIPTDDINPAGGAFAVAEGGNIAGLIVRLMERFAASGASVVATRDYHPVDHCSFIPQGGPFPPHCIQGHVGSFFYKPIGSCLKRLQALGRNADVVFKGFHEDVDSFGSFAYADEPSSWARVCNRPDAPCGLHGCSMSSWTGSVKLKCSSCDDDVDAPPDVLSCYRRQDLASLLKERNVSRIFACGLALDYCVLDTALNCVQAGFAESYIIMDAARAAHLPGIGSFGSGFMQDPAELKHKLVSSSVKVIPSAICLPELQVQSPLLYHEVGRVFPENLGPFALIPAKDLKLAVDLKAGKFTVEGPTADINNLKVWNVEPTGAMGPLAHISLDKAMRQALQIPESAVNFSWGYSLGNGTFDEKARGYFSITTPAAAFFVFGGFIYTNSQDDVVAVMSLSLGSGIAFSAANKWKHKYSASLAGRWQPVTAPLLRKKGARLFAWINPCEVLTQGEDPWIVSKHGAFAFLFHDDPAQEDARDVYFTQKEKTQLRMATLGRISHRETPKGEPHPEPSPMQKAEQPQTIPVMIKEVPRRCCVVS